MRRRRRPAFRRAPPEAHQARPRTGQRRLQRGRRTGHRQGHLDATVEHARRAGTVTVTYGSRSWKADKDSGSAEPQQRTLREGHDGLPEQAEPNDRFGAGLLTGDDGDGCTDLVVNAPGESWDGQLGAGRSMILWGSRRGPSGATLVDRGSAAAYNAFAFMAIGDFNADGHPDLVSPAGAGEAWTIG